jgi:hypothetical protein
VVCRELSAAHAASSTAAAMTPAASLGLANMGGVPREWVTELAVRTLA